MDGERVRPTSEKETCLNTLYGKALDSRVEDTILSDTFTDEAVRRGYSWPGTYRGLAECYAQKGQLDEGYQILKDYLAWSPDSLWGHVFVAEYLTLMRKLDEALEILQKAESLSPGHPRSLSGRFVVFVIGEEFDQAQAVLEKMQSMKDPIRHFWARLNSGLLHLYDGRSQEALTFIEQAVILYGEKDSNSANSHNVAAHILLETGRAREALGEAQTAQL
jgi:tetratricopeptide (TPR) repeat protein